MTRAARMRDVLCFVRPAGSTPCAITGSCWREAEGWTVWVRETGYAMNGFAVGARMFGTLNGCSVWSGPRVSLEETTHASLHAARVRACDLVFVLSGSMSLEGLARRCPRGRHYRDGRPGGWECMPWRWVREP